MMELAAKSGRLMVVGSLPGTVEVDPFTHLQLKELSVIGCYQPGAPIEGHAYYPWTQRRNRKVFLDMVESGKLNIDHLISHRLPYTSASQAYSMIKEHGEDCVGVVFEW